MRFAILGLFALLAMPAAAAPAFTPGGEAQAQDVIDGATIALADGRVVHLVGIDPPLRAALARQTKEALRDLVADQTVTLSFAGTPQDRHSRIAAQVYVGKIWIQGLLLKRGLVRVRSVADNRIGIAAMLKLEQQARRRHLGLWADPAYAIVDAATAERAAGTFALVTGTVTRVEARSGTTYVEFAATPRTGFTLSIASAVVKLCRAEGLDPASLTGKPLLVRGFVDGRLRPTIVITHPEQIEILRSKRTVTKKNARTRVPGLRSKFGVPLTAADFVPDLDVL